MGLLSVLKQKLDRAKVGAKIGKLGTNPPFPATDGFVDGLTREGRRQSLFKRREDRSHRVQLLPAV